MILEGESDSELSAGNGYWCLDMVQVVKARDRRTGTPTALDSCGVKVIGHLLRLQPGQSLCGLAASQHLHAQQGQASPSC